MQLISSLNKKNVIFRVILLCHLENITRLAQHLKDLSCTVRWLCWTLSGLPGTICRRQSTRIKSWLVSSITSLQVRFVSFFSTIIYLRSKYLKFKFGTRNLIQNEIADADVCNLDPELLLLKATSQATILCLGQCLSILQEQQIVPQAPPQPRVKKTPLHYIPPQPIDLAEKTKRWDHDCRSSFDKFQGVLYFVGTGVKARTFLTDLGTVRRVRRTRTSIQHRLLLICAFIPVRVVAIR